MKKNIVLAKSYKRKFWKKVYFGKVKVEKGCYLIGQNNLSYKGRKKVFEKSIILFSFLDVHGKGKNSSIIIYRSSVCTSKRRKKNSSP